MNFMEAMLSSLRQVFQEYSTSRNTPHQFRCISFDAAVPLRPVGAHFIDGLLRPSCRLIGSTCRTRRIHGSLSGALCVQLVLPALRILEAAVHHENNRDP
jgi:hypothetical protein